MDSLLVRLEIRQMAKDEMRNVGRYLFLGKKFIITVKYNQTNSYQPERQRGIVRVYLGIKK